MMILHVEMVRPMNASGVISGLYERVAPISESRLILLVLTDDSDVGINHVDAIHVRFPEVEVTPLIEQMPH
jgi:hypothetical protein